ncbi:MAG: hypothetical protein IH805_04100, partial [Proteobacteria bacterium]|nr:hypothetical protein [Pseudomonadota bacterium]
LPPPQPLGPIELQAPGWMPWDSINGGSLAMVRRRLIPTVAACATDDPTCADVSFKLTGRSLWNTRWLLIIPGSELQGADPANGIDLHVLPADDFSIFSQVEAYRLSKPYLFCNPARDEIRELDLSRFSLHLRCP